MYQEAKSVVSHTTAENRPKSSIRIKRIYDHASPDDGLRILVDRLWPRGLARDKAKLDHWIAGIAPSNELRKAFGHDNAKWDWFRERYLEELEQETELCAQLLSWAKEQTITLLFAAKDEEHNNAVVLKGLLERRLKTK